jgi:hypothetical protein
VGENPTRQSLQPEAIGAVMEVTKWLKPNVSRTTYFFTEISCAAMIASVECHPTKANHKIRILAN